MKFDAAEFARGWRAVALASAKDKGRPALDRTVCVEVHEHGVILVATDSYMLLRSWIPFHGTDSFEPEPQIDDAPKVVAVAIDPDGRAKSLLAHAQQLQARAGDDAARIILKVDLGVKAVDEGSFAGMEARYAILEIPDLERVKLQLSETEFPHWRRVIADFEPVATLGMALSTERVDRLVKLGNLFPSGVLHLENGGENKMIRVAVRDAEPDVTGAVMPVRWDVYANEPAAEPAPDPDDEDLAGVDQIAGQQEADFDNVVSMHRDDDSYLLAAGRALVVSRQDSDVHNLATGLRIGIAAADKILDALEAEGTVSEPIEGEGRKVLVPFDDPDIDDPETGDPT